MKKQLPLMLLTIIALTGCAFAQPVRATTTPLVGSTTAPTRTAAVIKTPPCNGVLIGWDGAQREHIQQALERGELPNLKQLGAEGALVDIDILHVTDTKAGWSQILTGYAPEITGVYSDKKYHPIPPGYTIFERLEDAFGPDQFVTVAVIGKKVNVDNDPPGLRPVKENEKISKGTPIVVKDGKEFVDEPGKPYFYTSQHMDVFLNGLIEDQAVGIKAMEYLEAYKDKPFFFFVQFAKVDLDGHSYGENSKEYNDALISVDSWTGKIIARLKELGLYQKTWVYVTADHGFDEDGKNHSNAPFVFLAANDPAVKGLGTWMDIAPTILDRFGLDLQLFNPPLSGHSLLRR